MAEKEPKPFRQVAKENPVGLGLVTMMTAARPVFGEIARRKVENGNLKKAEKWMLAAAATDLEGYPARWLNVTSIFGAKADPVADGMLRLSAARAFWKRMKGTVGTLTALELANLALNAKVQQGEEKPKIPFEAKVGTFIQFIGFDGVIRGIDENDKRKTAVGKGLIFVGTAIRTATYAKEYKKKKAQNAT